MLRKWLVAIGIAISMSSAVSAQPCMSDKTTVRHAFPGSWPSYTTQMEGHKGIRCWFPADDRTHKKWDKNKYQNIESDVAIEQPKTNKLRAKDVRMLKALAKRIAPHIVVSSKEEGFLKVIEEQKYKDYLNETDGMYQPNERMMPSEAVEICNITAKKLSNLEKALQKSVMINITFISR